MSSAADKIPPLDSGTEPEIMTLEEVAKFLRINRSTLLEMLHRKEIPAAKAGRAWRFSRSSVMAWLGKSASRTRGGKHERA